MELSKQTLTDVIIVGAGPAGTSAAYYLASAGIKVTLLDKAVFPREKVAGDMISPGAIRELQNMKITSLAEFNKIDRAGIYLNGRKLMTGLFPQYPDLTNYSVIVPRIVLDELTLDAAKKVGATIVEGFNVTDCQVNDEYVTIMGEHENEKVTLKSRLLIGADGHNSVIAKKLRGTTWPDSHKAVVVRGYFENVTGAANQGGVYYNDEDFVGYSWIFPLDMNRANVGIGLLMDSAPATKTPKELLMEHIKNDEGMKKRLEKAELKGELKISELNMYDPQMPLVSNRVMMIGEAAGLINGLNGEGTYFALLSGKWAAETALKCIVKNTLSEAALSAYSKRVEDELEYGFKVSNLMLGLVRNRSLIPVWMKTLEIMGDRSRKDPEYAKLTGAILSGMVFPNQEVTYKIVVGVIQEAATSTGFEVLAEMLKNPETIPANALKVTQLGFNIAKNALENPVNFFEWGLGSAVRMLDVASEVSKKFLAQKEED